MRTIDDDLVDIQREAREAERERCARLVPTNWCDPLLSGPGAPKLPLSAREVEVLLRGIQDRIRANEQIAGKENG
jgi:hypothetical protein